MKPIDFRTNSSNKNAACPAGPATTPIRPQLTSDSNPSPKGSRITWLISLFEDFKGAASAYCSPGKKVGLHGSGGRFLRE